MAAVINTISNPDDYPIIYYWRNDDYITPIAITDRYNKGVMTNIYNREKKCFELRINSYTFNRGVFDKNKDLKKVQFTESAELIDIADFAFQYSSVEEVNFDGVGVIGSSFPGCNNLKEITVPECVERIGTNAFASCAKLRKVKIEGAPMIGKNCFIDAPVSNCEFFGKCLYKAMDADGAYQTYKVKPGIESIAAGAFSETATIDKVIIPNSVLKVGYDAFEESNVTTVEFDGCPNIIYVPDESNYHSIFGSTPEYAENILLQDETLLPTIQSDTATQYANVIQVVYVNDDGVKVIKK